MSDALTQLRSALNPQRGLKRIPFPTESYEHDSLPLSAKRLLNYYIEQQPKDARTDRALISTPGAAILETLNAGPVVAFDTNLIGGWYAVSGGVAFRHAGGVTTNIGTVGTVVGTPSDPAQLQLTTIACSPTEVVIVVPPNAFAANHGSPTLTQLTPFTYDTATPPNITGGHGFSSGGARTVTWIDGYFVFGQGGSGTTFFWSPLPNAVTPPGGAFGPYNALDFATAEGMDNVLMRVSSHATDLWLLGYAGIEVWRSQANPDLPWRRIPGIVVPTGVLPRSVAEIDGSLFWAAPNGTIFRSNNYQPLRVSTHALEAIIEHASAADIIGMAYMQEGHAFYVVTLQDVARTFAYDCATGQWAERASSADGSGSWLALCAGRVGEGVYVGDKDGRLYSLDMTRSSDQLPAGDVTVRRIATLPQIWADTRRAFCGRVEIEMEVGGPSPPGNLLLEWSDDGGFTWVTGRSIPTTGLPPAGPPAGVGRRTRVVATRLGSFRQRVFRLTLDAHSVLYAVDADLAPGNT